MDANRFDSITRRLTVGLSRRRSLGLLATLGLPGLAAPDVATARKKTCPPCKKRKKGKCKANLPDGTPCGTGLCDAGTCVTGIGTCAVGANSCLDVPVLCNDNPDCFCIPNRAGATRCVRPYIGPTGNRSCMADTDCADLGTGAFCPPLSSMCAGYCQIRC